MVVARFGLTRDTRSVTKHVRDPRLRESERDAEEPAPAPEVPQIAYEPGGQLNRSVAARAALAQGYGNQAVGRILARDPNPELEAVKKVGHKTGAEVDTALDASPFFKPLIAEGVKAGKKADGHVHIHDAATFQTKCVAYLSGKQNPNTGAVFTDDEAKEFAKNVNAYQEGKEIHVHEERGEAATTVHESMHLFANDKWLPKVGFNANEGTTEYFTKKLCAELKLTRGGYYADQYAAVKKLVDYVGETYVAEAYFEGKLDELEAAVDKKAGEAGAGTFGKWLGYMKASKYAEAKALT
jgi:hypothetical protein